MQLLTKLVKNTKCGNIYEFEKLYTTKGANVLKAMLQPSKQGSTLQRHRNE